MIIVIVVIIISFVVRYLLVLLFILLVVLEDTKILLKRNIKAKNDIYLLSQIALKKDLIDILFKI